MDLLDKIIAATLDKKISAKVDTVTDQSLDSLVSKMVDEKLATQLTAKIEKVITEKFSKIEDSINQLNNLDVVIQKHLKKINSEFVAKIDTALEKFNFDITISDDNKSNINDAISEAMLKTITWNNKQIQITLGEKLNDYLEAKEIFGK